MATKHGIKEVQPKFSVKTSAARKMAGASLTRRVGSSTKTPASPTKKYK